MQERENKNKRKKIRKSWRSMKGQVRE